MPVFQSLLLAHMQKAGSCDQIFKQVGTKQRACQESGFSNTPKSYPML